MPKAPDLTVRGFEIHRGLLDRDAQAGLLDDLRAVLKRAPLRQVITPAGRQMSVRMSAAGRLGWITDRRGYRYAPTQPDGSPWPPIPARVLAIWQALTGLDRTPDCCLINFYGEGARMGLHQDRDEGDFSYPVVSVSLGDDGLFRMGNPARGGKTESIWLHSGDAVVMGGTARLAYHGVDRIRFKTSGLMPDGGRVNLTLRVVDQGASAQHPA